DRTRPHRAQDRRPFQGPPVREGQNPSRLRRPGFRRYAFVRAYRGRARFPVTYNVDEVLEGYATMKRLADSVDHIVPGHDPAVLAQYPAACPGLESLVVRLDVDPRK